MTDEMQCAHLDAIVDDLTPSNENGCGACIELGDQWVHLRICMSCGNVGCCNDSKNQHAMKQFQQDGHPIIQSFEAWEDWYYCYEDDVMMEFASA